MKNKTILNLLFSLIVLGLVGAGIFYGYSLVDEKLETVKLFRTRENQNKNYEFGTQLRTNMQTLTEQEARVIRSFIGVNRLVNFMGELEAAAQAQNLAILIEKVEQGEPEVLESGMTVKPVSFAIQLTGTYEDISTYVTQRTRQEENLIVTNLAFHKAEGVSYTARLTLAGKLLSQ